MVKRVVVNDLGLPERQRDVLRDLSDCDGWRTPMQLGGKDQSHHSATLRALVSKGYAEKRERGGHTRPAYEYRITAKGRALRFLR